jgi:hypothetical protein
MDPHGDIGVSLIKTGIRSERVSGWLNGEP